MYSNATVAAEKLEAVVSLGVINSRYKNLLDLFELLVVIIFNRMAPFSSSDRGKFSGFRCYAQNSASTPPTIYEKTRKKILKRSMDSEPYKMMDLPRIGGHKLSFTACPCAESARL
jgi:hypothetical protein